MATIAEVALYLETGSMGLPVRQEPEVVVAVKDAGAVDRIIMKAQAATMAAPETSLSLGKGERSNDCT